MRQKLLWLGLLLVAAANLALFIWIDRQQTAAEHPGALTALDPEAIRRIVLQRKDTTLRFERRGEDWWMTEPLEGRADAGHLTDLRAVAVLTPLARYPREGQPLADYGLAPPRLSLWLDGTRIDFGDRNAANGRRFVLTDDGLYLIADTLWPRLHKPPRAWLAQSAD